MKIICNLILYHTKHINAIIYFINNLIIKKFTVLLLSSLLFVLGFSNVQAIYDYDEATDLFLEILNTDTQEEQDAKLEILIDFLNSNN